MGAKSGAGTEAEWKRGRTECGVKRVALRYNGHVSRKVDDEDSCVERYQDIESSHDAIEHTNWP